MNKRGLATGLLALMVVMFMFAFFSLFSIFAWSEFNDSIQNVDNTTIDQYTKDKIDNLSFLTGWADKLFVAFFVALLIAYLISSATVPVDKPLFLVIFIVFLLVVTTLAALLSNTWAYLVADPNFVAAFAELPFTDYFMRYFPVIMFLTGVMGAIIFYGRKSTGPSFSNTGGDQFGFE